jgi:hypothetical protein
MAERTQFQPDPMEQPLVESKLRSPVQRNMGRPSGVACRGQTVEMRVFDSVGGDQPHEGADD